MIYVYKYKASNFSVGIKGGKATTTEIQGSLKEKKKGFVQLVTEELENEAWGEVCWH